MKRIDTSSRTIRLRRGFGGQVSVRAAACGVVLCLAFGLAAIVEPPVSAQQDGPSAASSSDPIRVGFIGPLSGAYAQNGRDILNGFLLYLDEIGYRAGGRKIELIVEDDQAIPAETLTKARKLIERDRVHVMAGTLLSSSGYALAPYIDSMHIPMIYPVVSADDLTQRRRTKWIIRTGWTGSQPNHAFGEYAYKNLKLRKVTTIALDYAFGWESVGGFERHVHRQRRPDRAEAVGASIRPRFRTVSRTGHEGRRRGVRVGARACRVAVHAAVSGVRVEGARAADWWRHVDR
jgi:hypothetical protein